MQDSFQERVFDRLVSLTTVDNQIKFISRLHLLSRTTVERLDEAVRTVIRTDLKKAQLLAEAAVAIADRLNDNESRAFALRAKANALWFRGENSPAAEMNTQAVRFFHEAGNSIEEARTLSTSIQPLILLGEYERAEEAGKQARVIFSAAGETVRLARLDINVGNIFHRQDRFREALDCYQRAHYHLSPDKDVEGIIAALHNIAVCLTALNEKEKALATYGKAIEFCRNHEMPLALSQAEYNIAYLHFLSGEYGRAIDLLRIAYDNSQQTGDAYHSALCRLDLAEIYLQLNLNQDAAELSQEAFNRFEKLGMGYEAAKAMCQQAIALSQQRKNFHALMLFAQARSMFIAEKNYVWPSLIDLYEAFAHYDERRYAEARRYCAAALDFFRDSVLPGRAILCQLLLAKISLKTGDLADARAQCRIALEKLTGRETPVLVYEAYLVMGQIEEAERNLQEAENCYLTARNMLESLRSGIRGEELKISFLENKLEVYESLVRISLTRNSAASRKQAWQYMEQAKSRNLLEMMVQGPAPAVTGEDKLPGRILALREQLNWYYHRIEVEQMAQVPAPVERLRQLRQQAEQHEKEFLHLVRELPRDRAEVAGLQQAQPASLEQVRASLGAEATLLEYFRVRDRMVVAVITPNDLEIIYLASVEKITEALGMLQQQFSQFHLGTGHVEQFSTLLFAATQKRLNELYQELIAPVLEKFRGRHLVIVPHESLHCVPFHALFDGNRYLIDLFTISYAPSASIYVECSRRQAKQTGLSLVLGIASNEIPFVAEEAQSLASILPDAKLFTGREASAGILRENAPACRLIHIATHGFFRKDRPLFSGVRLGDSFLTLYDIYNLKLPASHVTLSGCSTGVTAIATGDEIIGLTRGLLFAGARSVLLTLWDVDDSSTAKFMQIFYRKLVDHQDHALALQSAMQELRQSSPHPYYWAPFVHVGGISSR